MENEPRMKKGNEIGCWGSEGKEEMRAREREVRTGEGEAEEQPSDLQGQPVITGHTAAAPMDALYLNVQSSVSELELWTVGELLLDYSSS